MSILENLKRGTIELLLLTLLKGQDMYGYQLSQTLEQKSKGEFELQEGSLYPVLYRLEKHGYISSKQQKLENSRRIRIYYHLEPSGEQYLKEIKHEYIIINRGIMRVLELEGLYDQ